MAILAVLAAWETAASAADVDMAHEMAEAAAAEAVSQGKINDLRLPNNPAEEKALDQACLKGPRDFYGRLLKGPMDARVPATWANYGDIASDPLHYCREQIAAYRKAKISGRSSENSEARAESRSPAGDFTEAEIKDVEDTLALQRKMSAQAAGVNLPAQSAKERREQAIAILSASGDHVRKTRNEYAAARLPKNASEEKELESLAVAGVDQAYAWIFGPSGRKPHDSDRTFWPDMPASDRIQTIRVVLDEVKDNKIAHGLPVPAYRYKPARLGDKKPAFTPGEMPAHKKIDPEAAMAACKKGPREFYRAIGESEDTQVPYTWAEMSYVTNVEQFCRDMIADAQSRRP